MKFTLMTCLMLAAIYFRATTDKEEDSIDTYMRHWYAVCDTNSDGDIDDIK